MVTHGDIQQGGGSVPPAPDRYCDIVMKGGVTSGIVYPLAVCELAEKFRFVNIGGTSAGAIAAAVTAAAEYRRAHGDPHGFEQDVKGLPGTLASRRADGSTTLLSLFAPNPPTRRIFNALLGLLRVRGFRRVFAAVGLPLRIVPWHTILHVLLFAAVVAGMWWASVSLTPPPALLLLCLLTLIGAAIPVTLLWCCFSATLRAVVANKFGLCTGFIPGRPPETAVPLTEWLADLLDRTAGKDGDPAAPLTFGDLLSVGRTGRERINLQMMTTNLTHGRPYRLPFDQHNLYWDPEEFRDLFPERIISWMRMHSELHADGQRLRLPVTEHFPVIVAVRMSLSFPFLISAVPLWSADHSRSENKRREKEHLPEMLERSWFSDGGICSNFPVHFFDAPLPRWPTFAINLRPFHPDFTPAPDQRKNIWMPQDNGQGRLEQWVRFDENGPLRSAWGFVTAMVNTMQNWVDNSQLKMPGFRDRIAHVYLTEEEGGLNLEMKEKAIAFITERGRLAGKLLRDRFTGVDTDCVLTWDNHRWIRYRSTMTLLEKYLHDIVRACAQGNGSTSRTYVDLAQRHAGEPPLSYPLTQGQRGLAATIHAKLKDLVVAWDHAHGGFADGTPRPVPELRARPKI